MSQQFISSQALADTFHNTLGKVESMDSAHYDRIAASPKRQYVRKTAQFQHDENRLVHHRDMCDLSGTPGSAERIEALASFYANMEWADEDSAQSPFRDVPVVVDASPAKLGFFNTANDADASGNDLGDNV
jgi:hypothetical protein